MTLNNKQKLYIIILSFTVVYVAFVVFVILPMYSNIKFSSSDILLQKSDIYSTQKQFDNLSDFGKNKSAYKEDFDKAKEMLVDIKNPVSFIEFLEKTARQSGVSINIALSSTPAIKDLSDPWQAIYFQINCTGNFSDNVVFLEKMENAPYLISVQSTKIGKKESAKPIEVTYSIKVFGN